MNEFIAALENEVRRWEKIYSELMGDYNYIVELNRQMATKYEDLMSSFPTVKELDIILQALEMKIEYKGKKIIPVAEGLKYTEKERQKRIFQLRRFRSALVALEKQDVTAMPPKYEDVDK